MEIFLFLLRRKYLILIKFWHQQYIDLQKHTYLYYYPLYHILEDFSMFTSAVDRGFEPRSGQTKDYDWYLLLFRQAHSIEEKKQRLVGSESE